MRFWGSGLLGSLLDGVVFGVVLAIILVSIRGPFHVFPATPEQPPAKKRDRKARKLERASAKNRRRKAELKDYLQAWGMLAVIGASGSYAVAGGHGEYGIITGIIAATQTVSDPVRLGGMTILNMITFAIMGAFVWTLIWGIGMLPLKWLNPSWAQAARLYHGTIFGTALGVLIGLATSLNQAIAGHIVGPVDILFTLN